MAAASTRARRSRTRSNVGPLQGESAEGRTPISFRQPTLPRLRLGFLAPHEGPGQVSIPQQL